MDKIILTVAKFLAASLAVAVVFSCNKEPESNNVPDTPGEIRIDSESGDNNVTTCEEFSLKIQKVLKAKTYQWTFDESIKDKLEITDNASNVVKIIAKEALEIPAGAISVAAVNDDEISERSSTKDPIHVTVPEAGEFALTTGTKDVYVAINEEFTLAIEPTISATTFEWTIAEGIKEKITVSGENTSTLTIKASESMDIPAGSFSVVVSNEYGSTKPGIYDKTIYVAPALSIPESITISPEKTVYNNESFTLTASDVENAVEYIWEMDETIKDLLTMTVNGNGKSAVFKATTECIIPAESISVKAKGVVSMSEPAYYGKKILCKVPYAYKTKVYGSKTWIVENCRESGDDLRLGKTIDDFEVTSDQYAKLDILKPHIGRYYTWYEMMTGISGCTEAQRAEFIAAKNGKDDMGNAFTFDGKDGEYNVQLRGCCPEGWHVANCNDWWDLFATIEKEYADTLAAGNSKGKEGFSFTKGGFQKPDGTCIVALLTKATFYSGTAMSITNVGNLGAYLRGGTETEGLWTVGTDQSKYDWPGGGGWTGSGVTISGPQAHSVYYTPKKNGPVEFDWYPCSYMKYDGNFISSNLGVQGIYWFGFTDGANNRVAKAFRLKCDGHQFTQVVTGDAGFNAKSGRVNVRCVKNY